MMKSKYIYIVCSMAFVIFLLVVMADHVSSFNEYVKRSDNPVVINDNRHGLDELQVELSELKSGIELMNQNIKLLTSKQIALKNQVSDFQLRSENIVMKSDSTVENNQQYTESIVELKEEDRIRAMDDILYKLEADNNWDGQTEEKLRQNIQDVNVENIQLQNVSCQGIICRIELIHESEEALFEILEGSKQVVTWSHKGKTVTTIDDMGNNVTVMYVTKEGETFPQGF